MDNSLLSLLVGLALSMGLFGLGVVLYPKLKNEEQGYPMEAEIESALLPFVRAAIQAAYEAGERALEELGRAMDGADKKAIADSMYRLLPEQIGPFDLALVKRIVPLERWQQMIQDGYDAARAEVLKHQTHFEKLYEAWAAENPAEHEESASASTAN